MVTHVLLKTMQKLQIHKKNKFHKKAQAWLQPNQKQKQNHNQESSLVQQQPTPTHERMWIDVEPSKQNLALCDLSKKVINLLRHNQTSQREKDGAIEFSKMKFHPPNHHSPTLHWLDVRLKTCLQFCFEIEKMNSSVLCEDILEKIWSHVAGQCGDWKLNILLHVPRRMHIQCSFCCEQWIGSWKSNFGQKQIVFFLPVDPRDESVETLDVLTCVSRNTCMVVHGRGNKTRQLTLILRSKKD